jgi:hypothetical protein
MNMMVIGIAIDGFKSMFKEGALHGKTPDEILQDLLKGSKKE